MHIVGYRRTSQITVCVEAAPLLLLNKNDALDLIARQIKTPWNEICDAASLIVVDRDFLWRR